MDFIKKFFDEFKTPKYEVKDWPSLSWSRWEEEMNTPFDLYFTQAEKQQLKQLLSDVISSEEYARDSYINTARLAKVDGDKEGSTAFYKQAEKCQNKINSLAKLQYKLKYTLATQG